MCWAPPWSTLMTDKIDPNRGTTFSKRCDKCFGPLPCPQHEHPAARAARMIKELHQATIDLIDGGRVFKKDGVDVNYQVRDACLKQMDVCDGIIARADQMPVSLSGDAFLILKDLEDVVERKQVMAVVPETSDVALPEIGNYEHKKT